MEFLFSFFFSIFSLSLVIANPFTEFIYPDFTASNFEFVDASGTFLFSSNGKFKAAMSNPSAHDTRYYLCVIHVESNVIIWSANRDSPVSNSGKMILTVNGITITEADKSQRWSTPGLRSPVSSLQITQTGNLVLLGQSNEYLWESFRNPTDTIVIGQKLHLSTMLVSSASSDDVSAGDYVLALTSSDVVGSWRNHTYWKLSMCTTAYVDSNYNVEFLEINQTGLYLFGQNGSTVVISVNLPPSDFRIAKIDYSGQFIISSFNKGVQMHDFIGPVDKCRVPFICGKLGLCNSGVSTNISLCSCPLGFHTASDNTNNCIPTHGSYSLPVSCNSTYYSITPRPNITRAKPDSTSVTSSLNSSSFVSSYLPLGPGVGYFANAFDTPARFEVNLSQCQDLCSKDCACMGIFYGNSSKSCYKLKNDLGSVILTTTGNDRLGFIKTLVRSPPIDLDHYEKDIVSFRGDKVILPLIGVFYVIVIGILLWRRFRHLQVDKEKNDDSFSCSYSHSSSCDDLNFSIPGLPSRFSYEELQHATQNFKKKIGMGGYGIVYQGVLCDTTHVAVKKLTKLGFQGKKDFCTEIAVIGNIHHVNLVRLRGYCARRNEYLLVYEYMNRGSLDLTLFGEGSLLEWHERVEIAIGAASGLAYLHSGCEPKIVHCDVKPENILLHDESHVKISDFGLAKFMCLEDSSVFATMRGTRGYLAPEWLTRSMISDKTDVYSFGMVLLEIVSGRRNCLPSSANEIIFFPLYALEMHEQGRYLELVDQRLRDKVTNDIVGELVRLALCCVHQEPRLRPTMVNVVGMLEGKIPLDEPRAEELSFLRFYGRRSTEGRRIEESFVIDQVYTCPNANISLSSNSRRSVYDVGYSYVSSEQMSSVQLSSSR